MARTRREFTLGYKDEAVKLVIDAPSRRVIGWAIAELARGMASIRRHKAPPTSRSHTLRVSRQVDTLIRPGGGTHGTGTMNPTWQASTHA